MINNLLLNYQESNEFVCSDGRMSVNGICAVDLPDSVDASNLTKTIIETSQGDNREDIDKQIKIQEKAKNDKILKDLEGEADYFPDLGKEKKSFSWDMDKPAKVDSVGKTLKDGINAYDSYVEENFGIPKNLQTALRVGSSAYSLATGGPLIAAAGPFAIPAIIGMGMNKKEKERIERITEQDQQGNNKAPIDMMTYDIPTYGQEGFNIHRDAKDNINDTPRGPSNQQQSDYGYESDYGFI